MGKCAKRLIRYRDDGDKEALMKKERHIWQGAKYKFTKDRMRKKRNVFYEEHLNRRTKE